MKKGDKFIIILLGFVALLVIASVGYRFLSQQYSPLNTPLTQSLDTNTQEGSSSDSISPSDDSTNTDADSGEISNTNGNSESDSNASATIENEPIIAPDFTVTDLDGNEVSLSDYAGKPVIINFWATWCGPCQSEMPAFDKMYKEYGDEITFLMINVTDGDRDNVTNVTEFYKNSGYSFPIYFDTTLDASMSYGAYSIPLTFFINPDGSVFHGQMGAMSEDFLLQAIELLLKNTEKSQLSTIH